MIIQKIGRWAAISFGALAAFGIAVTFIAFPVERRVTVLLPVISAAENYELLKALAPPKRSRPLMVVVAGNDGSETADTLVPYGILKRSGVADVMLLGIGPGPVKLMPALTILPDQTIAEFDRAHREGADYVIVPAMHHDDDPMMLNWIRAQSAKGAMVIGICEGAVIVAKAGLLHGKRATTHWFRRPALKKADPTITIVTDRRYVVDGNVATTTGVSASLPMSLALVEAIAGRESADLLAQRLGVDEWGAEHDSGYFQLTRTDLWNYAANLLAFWRHETAGVVVADGVDDIALALTVDGFAATHRTRVISVAEIRTPVAMKSGLRLLPDGTNRTFRDFDLQLPAGDAPGRALDVAAQGIQMRYGAGSVNVMRLELEYSAPAKVQK